MGLIAWQMCVYMFLIWKFTFKCTFKGIYVDYTFNKQIVSISPFSLCSFHKRQFRCLYNRDILVHWTMGCCLCEILLHSHSMQCYHRELWMQRSLCFDVFFLSSLFPSFKWLQTSWNIFLIFETLSVTASGCRPDAFAVFFLQVFHLNHSWATYCL